MCTKLDLLSYNLKSINFPFDETKLDDTKYLCHTVKELVNRLANEACISYEVNFDQNEDISEFYQSILTFLSKYSSPYDEFKRLISTHDETEVSDLLKKILNYLSLEIKAFVLVKEKTENESANIQRNLNQYLTRACIALGLDKPPTDIGMLRLLKVLHDNIQKKLKILPENCLGNSFVHPDGLSPEKWDKINEILGLLEKDFSDRKKTLIQRLDLTIESFKWSEKGKAQLKEIEETYAPIRKALLNSATPGLAHLLAAKTNDLLTIEKTSGASARRYTACDLNKILIGKVPDRGGRTWEIEPPPKEMPAFQKRISDSGGNRDRGNFRGRGRGRGDQNYQPYNKNNRDIDRGDLRNKLNSDRVESGVSFRNEPIDPKSLNLSYQSNSYRGRGRGRSRGSRDVNY